MSRKPERQKFTVSPSICVKRANCGKRANCVGQAVCGKRANCRKRADCEKGGAKSLRDEIFYAFRFEKRYLDLPTLPQRPSFYLKRQDMRSRIQLTLYRSLLVLEKKRMNH